MTMIASLEHGRDAVRRHAWDDAVEALRAADLEGPLAPDDLELLGTSAWWAGRPDESTEALERAFAGHQAAGRHEDAAGVALWLAYHAFRRIAPAIAAGWLAQAQRLLADLPESRWHGFVAIMEGQGALMAGDIDGGIARLDQAMEIGRQRGSPDALYVAMAMKGLAQVMAGHWPEGLAALDEAAAAATSGPLDLRSASDIYCMTIGACRGLGDLDRATQWADESERWMRRQGAGGYPGVCRVHRAELKMLHGQWTEAEHEARQACDELQRFRLMDGVGFAQNAVGEIRLRMGDLDGASEAFDRAYEFGHDGQPGRSLLLLARGQVDEAARSIGRALAAAAGTGGSMDRSARGRLLPAQVSIALAGGDVATAAAAVEELETIAADFERPLYQAGALTARGELLLGENNPSEASSILGRSWRMWQTTDLPYEAARTRLHYAEALTAMGDEENARRDLAAARATFERLGATLDLQRVDALMGGSGTVASRPSHGRVTRTFMFTDIVTSTDLVSLIGDESWMALLEWHDRELRDAVTRHRGDVVNHTGDGFFAAFERPADAIEGAVDIQRRLARHRQQHGFAPSIRIGLHMAEATGRGRDYVGRGVHVAARIGAAAGSDEILVSSRALEGAGSLRFPVSDPRQLTLKGVREPVEARTLDWRV
jgi:class 3 adenylate cyclase